MTRIEVAATSTSHDSTAIATTCHDQLMETVPLRVRDGFEAAPRAVCDELAARAAA